MLHFPIQYHAHPKYDADNDLQRLCMHCRGGWYGSGVHCVWRGERKGQNDASQLLCLII